MVQINELFGNRKRLSLLLFFAANPRSEFTFTQLQKKTKLAKATLAKWLKHLRRDGFLKEKPIGIQRLYRLNAESMLIKQLKVMLALASLDFLIPLSEKHGVEAYVYGSAARGEDVEESDIDILIIGKVRKEELMPEIQKQSAALKRPIRMQVFTTLEWAQMLHKDKAFYERVEKDKIRLQ